MEGGAVGADAVEGVARGEGGVAHGSAVEEEELGGLAEGGRELAGVEEGEAELGLVHALGELVDAAADSEMNWVIGLIEEIRSVRAQMHVPAGLKVPVVVRNMSEEAKAAYDGNEALIKKLARMDELHVVAEFPKGTAALSVTGAEFGLPLADIIDVDEEKARLEKSLGKLAKEIGGMRGRLGNPKFVASAPDEVVEETRANLAEREEEEGLMKAALKRLAEI